MRLQRERLCFGGGDEDGLVQRAGEEVSGTAFQFE